MSERFEKKGNREHRDRDRDRDSREHREHREHRERRMTRFVIPEGEKIDYKNINLLLRFVSDRGKIQPRRITGISAKEQRVMAAAIKHARYLSLIHLGSRAR